MSDDHLISTIKYLESQLEEARQRIIELEKPKVPYCWMTLESSGRLSRGGNCKGAVPVHKNESSVAKVPLYL